MPKTKMKCNEPMPELETDSLNIATLAGLHTHARTITRILPGHMLATADQLATTMKTVMQPKNRDQLVQLHRALEALAHHNHALGLTTLVRPADHPLVARHIIPREEK
jgi:hypothetical protein